MRQWRMGVVAQTLRDGVAVRAAVIQRLWSTASSSRTGAPRENETRRTEN